MFLFITSSSVFCLYLLREPQGIIACCNPVPPLVRQYINELHLLVQQAREMPLLKVRKDEWQQGGCFGIISSMFEMSLMIWETRIGQILQYLLHFTQAEIAAQKKKGLTPIKKVGLNSNWFWRLNDCRGNECGFISFSSLRSRCLVPMIHPGFPRATPLKFLLMVSFMLVCALRRSNDSRFQPIRLCIDASFFFSQNCQLSRGCCSRRMRTWMYRKKAVSWHQLKSHCLRWRLTFSLFRVRWFGCNCGAKCEISALC